MDIGNTGFPGRTVTQDGKPRELVISKDPLKVLKDTLEKEMGKPEEPKVVTE